MSAKILANNAFWSLLSHFLSRGSLIVATIIVARNFDAREFASFSYFQLTISMMATYSALGLGVTASKFFAQFDGVKVEEDSPPVGTLWCLSIIIALLCTSIILYLPDSWLSAGLDVPRSSFALGVLAVALNIVPGGAILGLEQYPKAAIVSAVSGVLILIGAIIASYLSSTLVAIYSVIFAALVLAAGNSLIVLRIVGWKYIFVAFSLKWKNVCQVFSFAGPMFFVSLMSASGAWIIGRIILLSPQGETAFAVYTIGLQWFSLGMLMPGMLSRVILPRLVKFSDAEASGETAIHLVKSGTWMAVGSAMFIAISGIFVGPWLISIYGDNFEPDKWIIFAYLVIAVLLAPANVIGNAIVANNGQFIWLLLTSVWLSILIIMGLAFQNWGAWTGVIAHAAGAAVLVSISFLTGRKRRVI